MHSPTGPLAVGAPRRLTLQELRRRLLEHYDAHRRSLPWRGESDPYRIWVSEVMLQQTRVETVIPYYRRWVERFPDVHALALADEDDVLHAWEGLGYYSRARNLQRAARLLRDRHGGELPQGPAALQKLPGFGSYTAGAVASIAFGVVVPAVDGNVRRVLCRVFDLPDPSAPDLRRRAARLVDPLRPGDFNQALMELGATLCTPRSPRCGSCPLQPLCRAHARGTIEKRPRKRVRKPTPERTFAVAVLTDARGRALLVRRPREGLLAGLWAFPEAPLEDGVSPVAAALRVSRALGIVNARQRGDLEPVDHVFTHLRARYLPSLLQLEEEAPGDEDDRRWVIPSAPGLALPSAQKRIMMDVVRRLALGDARLRTARSARSPRNLTTLPAPGTP